jgi:S1-C subfamily serine protease
LLDSVKKEFAEVYGLEKAKGAIITDIRDKKGAAAKAGIKKDDIILEVDGVEIENHQDLIEKIAVTSPDKDVNIVLLREVGENLERKSVTVRLGERPNASVADDGSRRKLPVVGRKQKLLPFGMTLVDLGSKSAKGHNFGSEKGVLIRKIDPASYIADVKSTQGGDALSEGDLIQRINRRKVSNLKEFNEFAKNLKKGSPVVLHVLRYDRRGRGLVPTVVQFTVK